MAGYGDAVMQQTGGAAHVLTGAGSVTAYGAYPASYYLDVAATVTAQTAATLATLTGLASHDALALDVYAITGTTPTIKFYPSFDGVTFSATAIAITDLASAALSTAIAGGTGIVAVGNYMIALPVKCRSLRIDYTASVAGNAAIRGGMWKR